jgi:uncharacterized protein DUF6932
MSNAAIPSWNSQGVLSPINQSTPTMMDRSPYIVQLTDIIMHFGISPQRLSILTGFLDYRSTLHDAGLINGFQWVNGSFMENIETIENRKPNDIDIVTFFHLPNSMTQESFVDQYPDLFKHELNKQKYHVDSYFVHLNGEFPEFLVDQSTYWYSMWSHRRNEQWKGYLQIDLAPTDDPTAKANIDNMTSQGE